MPVAKRLGYLRPDGSYVRGTPQYRAFQAGRYQRPARPHAVSCRHCGRDVAETRQDALTGVCTVCLRQGRR